MVNVKFNEVDSTFVFSVENSFIKYIAGYSFENKCSNNYSHLLPILEECKIFKDYLSLFTQPKSLQLHSITFQEILFIKDKIDSIKVAVTFSNSQDNDSVLQTDSIVLKGERSVLIILIRVLGPPKRDMCTFVKITRPSMGLQDYLEFPEGGFDHEEKFIGPTTNLIKDVLGLTIYKSNLVNLTKIAYENMTGSISLSRDTFESLNLYLFRCNIEQQKFTEFEELCERNKLHVSSIAYNPLNDDVTQNNEIKHSQKRCVQLKLVPLGDAWRATNDTIAANAIFLIHELRYHFLMPQFRSVGGGDLPTNKKSAHFIKVTELEPISSGINLRVKVVRPIDLIYSDLDRQDNKTLRGGSLVVGDDGGIITLRLKKDQLNIKSDVGTPLIIRNAKIHMESGHMILSVDRWGKIDHGSSISPNEDGNFNFVPLETNDVSATEFELVVLDDEELASHNNLMEHTTSSNMDENVENRETYNSGRYLRGNVGKYSYSNRGSSIMRNNRFLPYRNARRQ